MSLKILELAGSDPTVLDRVPELFAARAAESGMVNAAGEFVADGRFRTMVAAKE